MTPLSFKGLASGNFWPIGTLPDYSTPGQRVVAVVDAQGNLAIRGSVTTDEGGFRDSFGGALSGDWTATATLGGSVAPTGAAPNVNMGFSIAAGSAAGARAYIAREIDYMPISAHISLASLTRVANCNFFFGLYSDIDMDVALAGGSYVEYEFLGSAVVTLANLRSQWSATKGQTITGATVTSTSTAGFRSILLDGESAQLRDGATTLPTPTLRGAMSTAIPDLYTQLYFACGLRNIGVNAAICSASIATAYAKNADRLIVNTAW